MSEFIRDWGSRVQNPPWKRNWREIKMNGFIWSENLFFNYINNKKQNTWGVGEMVNSCLLSEGEWEDVWNLRGKPPESTWEQCKEFYHYCHRYVFFPLKRSLPNHFPLISCENIYTLFLSLQVLTKKFLRFSFKRLWQLNFVIKLSGKLERLNSPPTCRN